MIFSEIPGSQVLTDETVSSNLLVLNGGVLKNYAKGECIFHEGDHAHFYHQVLEGRVQVFSDTESGEFIQGFFYAGQSFGEPPIFDDSIYTVSAMAVKPSIIVRLNISAFLQLLKKNFNVHFNITRVLSEQVNNKASSLKDVCLYSPEQLIIKLLNAIRKEKIRTGATSLKVNIDYTRKQFANMTGLRIETVIRIMRNLHNKGIISIEKRNVFY